MTRIRPFFMLTSYCLPCFSNRHRKLHRQFRRLNRSRHGLHVIFHPADPGLLRGLGVSLDVETGIPSHDPASMETDVPGVYIAGVLAAGFDANKIFIQNGREHGAKIVRRIAEGLPETPRR